LSDNSALIRRRSAVSSAAPDRPRSSIAAVPAVAPTPITAPTQPWSDRPSNAAIDRAAATEEKDFAVILDLSPTDIQ
jgi:hypothetical protein